jgi:hypothetical protein
VCEHLSPHQHFVQNEPCAPNVAFLIVLLKFEHFRGSIKRRTSPFSHLNLNISCEAKVSNFQFLVFVEEDIVRLKIAVEFF